MWDTGRQVDGHGLLIAYWVTIVSSLKDDDRAQPGRPPRRASLQGRAILAVAPRGQGGGGRVSPRGEPSSHQVLKGTRVTPTDPKGKPMVYRGRGSERTGAYCGRMGSVYVAGVVEWELRFGRIVGRKCHSRGVSGECIIITRVWDGFLDNA